jgi:hypothetical protein
MSEFIEEMSSRIDFDIGQIIGKAVTDCILEMSEEYAPVGFLSDEGEKLEVICTDFKYDLIGDEESFNRFGLEKILESFVSERQGPSKLRIDEEARQNSPELMQLRQILQQTIEQIDGLRDLNHYGHGN